MVMIKGFVDRVEVVAAGQTIATHSRCLRRGTVVLDPIHYLASLGRKPGALDPYARVPGLETAAPASLRSVPSWNNTTAPRPVHGGSCGSCNSWASIPWTACVARWKPVSSITWSVPKRSSSGRAGFAAIESQARRSSATIPDSILTSQVDVPLPDLSRFNQLLGGSERRDGSPAEVLIMRVDLAPPESGSNVAFAGCHPACRE